MSLQFDRRSIVAGAGLGLGALATGGFALTQYSTRNHLRFRPLESVNKSDDPVTLTVTALEDGSEVYEGTYDLEPAGAEDGGDRRHLPGPWIKRSRAYSIRVSTDSEEFRLENDEIIDRLEDTGWGSDCARVTIVLTEAGGYESQISTSDVC